MTDAERSNRSDIRILVADDDPDVLDGTAHLLRSAGYTVDQASDGEEALRAVQNRRPDLVLTDRDMPGIGGIEVCGRIKANPDWAAILVIIVSGTFIESAQRSEGLEAGADGYITRPVANRELLARVDSYVRMIRLTRLLQKSNRELQEAFDQIKTLRGIVPICASCKKIRDDQGYWSQVEVYVRDHTEAEFSHGLCPECVGKFFPELEHDEGS